MSDLKVDYETLRSSAATARVIKSAFDDLASRVGDTQDCWGHRGIADAMHTFGTNWRYHRTILSEEIQATGDKLEKCLEVFEEADQALASSAPTSTVEQPVAR
ncbi:hypothetical protein [Blastococcus sp. TF02A-35]|uniref:WXG100 family type VII secretion target n=1 Tax=Blastococcus sp. TF02A-35 TaxID=2559612 RepID=UPI0010741BFC|nr:hypothetical protein [Blastococcus sp. TF02A_35]TFV53403.1 hypothetical protein E4P43_02375 [Blastococcus sp. TF02A_35]